jgi:hypothetical protein
VGLRCLHRRESSGVRAAACCAALCTAAALRCVVLCSVVQLGRSDHEEGYDNTALAVQAVEKTAAGNADGQRITFNLIKSRMSDMLYQLTSMKFQVRHGCTIYRC